MQRECFIFSPSINSVDAHGRTLEQIFASIKKILILDFVSRTSSFYFMLWKTISDRETAREFSHRQLSTFEKQKITRQNRRNIKKYTSIRFVANFIYLYPH